MENISEVSFEINGKNVVVRKLPLKKYAELLGAFEELPKHLDLVNGKSNDEILANIPQIISVCYPDVQRVVHVVTEMTNEEIDQMGLDDLIKIIEAALKVNNYSDIYSKIKKMMAPRTQGLQPEAIGDGSGGQ